MPEPTPVHYDARLGQSAFDSLAPARDALVDVAPAPRLDLGAVAVVALGVAARIAQPAMRNRFRGIEREVSPALIDRLEPAAWALWYAQMQRDTHEATTSEAMLPAELVQSSTALRGTMISVAKYVLADDATVAREIAAIVSGGGYLDLAGDLGRLATLFDDHAATLALDRIRYRSDQPAQARALASRIVKALGQTTTRPWHTAVDRSYAVLDATYEPIRELGRAMYRRESPEALFPSLFSVRAAATPRTPVEGDTPST